MVLAHERNKGASCPFRVAPATRLTVPHVGLLALGGEFPSPPTCGLSCRAVPLKLLDCNDGGAWSSSQTKTRDVFRGSGLCPDGF